MSVRYLTQRKERGRHFFRQNHLHLGHFHVMKVLDIFKNRLGIWKHIGLHKTWWKNKQNRCSAKGRDGLSTYRQMSVKGK